MATNIKLFRNHLLEAAEIIEWSTVRDFDVYAISINQCGRNSRLIQFSFTGFRRCFERSNLRIDRLRIEYDCNLDTFLSFDLNGWTMCCLVLKSNDSELAILADWNANYEVRRKQGAA